MRFVLNSFCLKYNDLIYKLLVNLSQVEEPVRSG